MARKSKGNGDKKADVQPDKKRAAIYARVSTMAQASEDKDALPRQVKDCTRRAKADGFVVPDRFIFQETGSGADARRPQFQRMLEEAEAGGFLVLYVWAIDRFGRKMFDTIDALRRLKEAGVELRSGNEPALSDEAMLGMFIGLAEREHRRIRERTLPAKLAKRDRGEHVTGLPPFGYRKVEGTNKLVQAPHEEWIVRKIFNLCIGGLGRMAIAKELNNTPHAYPPEAKVLLDGKVKRVRPGWILEKYRSLDEYLTSTGGKRTPYNKGGLEWSSRSVARILGNRSAHGVHVTKDGKEINLQIDGGAIISRQVFDQARRAMSNRYRKGRAHKAWLLVRKMTCGSCSARYIHHESKGTHYYACGARRAGKSCKSPHIRLPDADRQVVDAVRNRLGEIFQDRAQIQREYEALLDIERSQILDQIRSTQKKWNAAKKKWKKLEQEYREAREKGTLPYLPTLERDLIDAGKRAQVLDGEISDLQTRQAITTGKISKKTATRRQTIDEIVAAVDTLGWDSREDPPHPEMFQIIHTMVEEVVALPDRTVDISLVEGQEAVLRVFDYIAQTEKRRAEAEHDVLAALKHA